MQNEVRPQPTWVSPPAGFAERVMARLEERERAQARRRTLIGVGLLAAAGALAVSFLVIWIGLRVSLLLANVGEAISWLWLFVPLISGSAEGLLVALRALFEAANNPLVFVYAAATLGLALLWARLVTGSLRLPLTLFPWEERK